MSYTLHIYVFLGVIFQLKESVSTIADGKTDDTVVETTLQASLAATGALAMLESLARVAEVKQYGQHIPPVITITSVGSKTSVWLAFSDIISDEYRDHVRYLNPTRS